jgi:hypothetical protein
MAFAYQHLRLHGVVVQLSEPFCERLITELLDGMMKLTEEDVEELCQKGASRKGGWSKRQFAVLDIEWPPEKGWKKRLVGRSITADQWNRFIDLNPDGDQTTLF